MHNYCTLFDSNYLTRGLAMYESLKKYSDNFHLYIFAFDEKSDEMLRKLFLEHVTIISLSKFEDEELLNVKGDRSIAEYCWTCTPSIIKYSIENYGLDNCTYVDADIYFFSNPSVLIDEMGGKSILITEHRFTPKYDATKASGKYCVQFMTFKDDVNGMLALNWWREACLDWCYAKFEDGKIGDQGYLNDWMTRFEGVHELQNLGGGVAPWNVQQYDLSDKSFGLVFYHFQGYRMWSGNKIALSVYKLSDNDINLLYRPYTKHLDRITQDLLKFDNVSDYNGIAKKRFSYLRVFVRWLYFKSKGFESTVVSKKYLLKG